MQTITGCRSTRASLVLAVLSASVAIAVPLFAQSGPSSSIPSNAVVIERARVPATVHPNRELLLWMISPVKHDRGPLSENPYMCPEVTLGSYYSGPTRLSLLDTQSGKVINTIKLVSASRKALTSSTFPNPMHMKPRHRIAAARTGALSFAIMYYSTPLQETHAFYLRQQRYPQIGLWEVILSDGAVVP